MEGRSLDEVTEEKIAMLRDKAKAVGDLARVAMCNLALAGFPKEIDECLYVLERLSIRPEPTCECIDPKCPIHGDDICSRRATMVIQRIDFSNESYVRYCEECVDGCLDVLDRVTVDVQRCMHKTSIRGIEQ